MADGREHIIPPDASDDIWGQERNGGENIPMHQINPSYQEEELPVGRSHDSENMELRNRQKSNLYRQSSIDDAKDILSMMPSRNLSRTKSRVGHDTDYVDYEDDDGGASRGSFKRRKSMYRSLRGRPDELNGIIQDIENDPELACSEVQRDKVIRDMPTNLTNRKMIKRQLSQRDRRISVQRRPGYFRRLKYYIQLRMKKMKFHFNEFRYRFDLWHSHLRMIEGHFGTGVVSYFTFLRTLLFLNIPVFLLSACFIVIPQLVFRFLQQNPPGYVDNEPFTGKELLTGGGWFEKTEMYYGYYTNETISVLSSGGVNETSPASYDMKYAYLLTSGGFYILCLLILAKSLASSYRRTFIEGSEEMTHFYVVKVLSGWNHMISTDSAAKLKHRALYNELSEHLSSGQKRKVKKSRLMMCGLILLRALTNVFVLALIGGSGYLIWYISSTKSLQNDIDVLSEMAMPLCISAFNLVLPIAFSIIGAIEQYELPKTELYLTMLRTIILKGANLGVLIYFWYANVGCEVLEDKTQYQKDSRCIPCWETFMGEEIYRLVIVDFAVCLLVTFFTEYIRKVMAKYCCKVLGNPEFNIAINTLNLIYSQALCWLGHFYSPVLSLIQIVKLIIIFYVKRLSVMMNCVPSQKPWRAARAHTIFLGYLFCAFLMMCASLAVSIVLIRPSGICGPFQGLSVPYEIVVNLFDQLQENHAVLSSIISFITTAGFLAACLMALGIGVYYLYILSKTRKEMVNVLKHQIQLEGKDKVFLLRMYQDISDRIGGVSPPHKPLRSPADHHHGQVTSIPLADSSIPTVEVHSVPT